MAKKKNPDNRKKGKICPAPDQKGEGGDNNRKEGDLQTGERWARGKCGGRSKKKKRKSRPIRSNYGARKKEGLGEKRATRTKK